MQAVDVLGDDRRDEPAPLELDQRQMAGIRLGTGENLEAERVELPDLGRIAPEGIDRGVLHRVVLGPDAGGRPEVGNTALRRDACACQDYTRLRFTHERSQGSDRLVHRRRVTRVGEFRFSTEVTVRFAETDAQGVAHNSNYLVWFEVARIAYLAEYAGGYQALRDQGLESFVLESHVRYRQPAQFDDRLRIHARIRELRGARFRFDYEVTRDGDVIADGWTSHACVDAKTLRPTRIPQGLALAITTAEA